MKETKTKKVTILNCSEREFNIRWWGMAITMFVFGFGMGVLMTLKAMGGI